MEENAFSPSVPLCAEIDTTLRRIVDKQMPSLRVLHDVERVELEYVYSGYEDGGFHCRRSDGAPTHPGMTDMGKVWAEMLDAALSPGFVAEFRGRLIPVDEPSATLSPIFLASAALAISDWPDTLHRSDYKAINASLKLSLEHRDGGELTVRPEVNMTCPVKVGPGGPVDGDVINRVHSHWAYLADKMGPWLADSGIVDLNVNMLVPIKSEPLQVHPPRWPAWQQ
ncbi:hypothetical protein [Pelagibius marinus]|uniref:hypothetical protein n=1 Tax=Pelagibius marinus TaxID=2762760 RepID=UPI00187226E9|nr:hypothetical protein [Pelagibius marinus]